MAGILLYMLILGVSDISNSNIPTTATKSIVVGLCWINGNYLIACGWTGTSQTLKRKFTRSASPPP